MSSSENSISQPVKPELGFSAVLSNSIMNESREKNYIQNKNLHNEIDINVPDLAESSKETYYNSDNLKSSSSFNGNRVTLPFMNLKRLEHRV